MEHSLSPRMFSAAFSSAGLDMVYLAFRVSREDLASAIEGLRAVDFVGCNVTMPHKLAAAKLVDRLEGTAELACSINVISNNGGKLVGFNTDGAGALASLENVGVRLDGRRILLIGYGGVARAVAFELAIKKKPLELLVTGRSSENAARLVRDLMASVPVQAKAIEIHGEENFDVIINATPVGMDPQEPLPLPETVLRPGTVVFDLVYHPLETKLLQLAAMRGCTLINGVEMLVRQGALAYERWTGLKAPVETMRTAAQEGLI